MNEQSHHDAGGKYPVARVAIAYTQIARKAHPSNTIAIVFPM
jgi:hypothetical protein